MFDQTRVSSFVYHTLHFVMLMICDFNSQLIDMTQVKFEHTGLLTSVNSVTMVRSWALIITLLLRSGDVELNPGPMTEEGEN